jgi:hypothetical protein
MTDISEAVEEAVERAQEEASSLNSIIAALVAIAATFMALCNVKDGNIVQGMAQAQAHAIDQWSYYQSKGTKLNIAENALDQLTLQRAITPSAAALIDARIAVYQKQIAKYSKEKDDIRKVAEGAQKDYDALNFHDDQFDMSEACMSVSIALFGITALTRKRWLLGVACVFMVLGVTFGLAGFFAWRIHPDFFARWLS